MSGRTQAIGRFLIALLGVLVLVPVAGAREKVCVAGVIGALLLARVLFDRSRYDQQSASTFGFLLPLVPWIGPNLLIVSGVWFFVLRPAEPATSRREMGCSSIVWAAPFLSYLFGAVLGEFLGAFGVVGLGFGSVTSTVSIDGAMRAVDVLRSLLEVHVPTWAMFVRVLLAVLLISFFSDNRDARGSFVRWLLCGCALSAAYVILQWLTMVWLEGSLLTLPNQTGLWNALGRPSGLMTDPNALGVVLALALWLWFLQTTCVSALSWWGWCWVGLLLAAGIVSGSRTFLLAASPLIPLAAWREGRRRLVWGAAACVVVAVVVVSVLDRYSGLVEQLVASQGLPSGIKRGFQALSLMRLDETFMSRSVFVEFAREIGRGHWLFGVGADRFIDYVPLVGAKRDLVRGWRDNSNNLYIGILVELGILGGLTFLLMLFGRVVHGALSRGLAVAALVMLAVLGCTGPHTDFTEVFFIVAALIALTTAPRVSVQPRYGLVAIVTGVMGIVSSCYREQGVYGWSNDSAGASRWLSHHAVIEAECKRDGDQPSQARILLQPRYIPQTEPLRVQYSAVGGDMQEVLLRSPVTEAISVPCDPGLERVFVRVVTRPPWSPYRAWPGASHDRRLLGVEQVYRQG